MDIKLRFQHAQLIAEHYADFRDFAADGMAFLGFPLTPMQADISEYMGHGPRLRMVMAQRGEAKSTLAALYAVWRIIQRTSCRVLIVSGGERQASEVATLVIRLIMQWDILEYLRPDRNAGDRSSVEAFDVHFALKGLDKSPSVACVGITANLPGKRADLLIADDIETTKNGMSATQRAQLLHVTKEFSSICTHGDILYLGTPQTKESVYNSLTGRGFSIRIWPGRFPNSEEIDRYGDKLAPFVSDRLREDPSLGTGGGVDGTRGKPSDPHRFDEEALQEKELDQGPEGFSLQFMLDTTLSDEARQQLRLVDFMVANFDWDQVPEIMAYQAAPKYAAELPREFPVYNTTMYHPVPVECDWVTPGMRMMYIDPAGGGADELAYGISTAVGPYVHVLDVGGLKGGLTGDNPTILCDLIAYYGVTLVQVESNMGHGLFEINLRAELERRGMGTVGVVGEYSTGQKERRIIDSVVSAAQRHRIILHRDVFRSDEKYGRQHALDKRNSYSLFWQISAITTDRNSLPHDDRIEAFAGCVRYWKQVLTVDAEKASERRKAAEGRQFIANPMGYADQPRTPTGTRGVVRRRRY